MAVKFVGGKTNIFKTAITNILAGFVTFLIQRTLNFYATIISFIVLLLIYREMFRLKWFKAFLVWILQFVFLAILIFVASLIFGIGIISLIF